MKSSKGTVICKYLFPVLVLTTVLSSCNVEGNKKKRLKTGELDFGQFHYIHHFMKSDLEQQHISPATYQPKLYDLKGRVSAKVLKGDSLIRFVYKSKPNQHTDSAIEIYKRIRLTDKENSQIPSQLLGYQLLGVYNSLNEDMPENFYFCFYIGDQDNLLKVAHLYKPGNVSAAFFYSQDSIDPTIGYKKDVARMLAMDRSLNLTDSAIIKLK